MAATLTNFTARLRLLFEAFDAECADLGPILEPTQTFLRGGEALCVEWFWRKHNAPTKVIIVKCLVFNETASERAVDCEVVWEILTQGGTILEGKEQTRAFLRFASSFGRGKLTAAEFYTLSTELKRASAATVSS